MRSLRERVQARDLHLEGHSNAHIARILGVPRGTIGYWFHCDRAEGLLKPLDRPSQKACPRCSTPPQPPKNQEAYCYLLGQYLGDGHIVTTVKTSVLRVSCDNKYPSIMDECSRSMLEIIATNVHRARKRGCSAVSAYSKHWPCLLPQHGPGPKHTRPIVLEGWQRELVAAHPRPFLRGLIHADGCRVTNHTTRGGKRYEYPRYHFSNMSADIMALCGWAFDLVGVEWRWSNYKNLSVARRDSVAVLDAFIGPKS